MARSQAEAGDSETGPPATQARPVVPADRPRAPAVEEALIAAHADWSVDPRKRWITIAIGGPGAWCVAAPAPVGPVGTLLARLSAAGEAVALGVDFPLGLPRAYAERYAAEDSFPDFLRSLANPASRFPRFFEVCGSLAEIAPGRPFYPNHGIAGMTRQSHALALGLDDAAALSRRCDRATAERPAGAPVFWTLGANQSGKAAIAAWRDLVVPALAAGFPLALWPFDGPLRPLLRPGRVVVAETYPAEAMRQLGLRLTGSKRRQTDRMTLAGGLQAALAEAGAVPDPALTAAIEGGFGVDGAGEDRFDSVLGLLCVLSVCAGRRTDAAPDDPWIRRWEGWVLGQSAPLSATPAASM